VLNGGTADLVWHSCPPRLFLWRKQFSLHTAIIVPHGETCGYCWSRCLLGNQLAKTRR